MPRPRTADLPLADLVADFARAIRSVGSAAPVEASYKPGIGPLREKRTVQLVMAHLAKADPRRYASYQLEVPYGDGTRHTCNICLGGPAAWEWAIEVKMLRLLGDNGRPNDNMVTHVLSPYPTHNSALTDCTKLVTSRLGVHKAILIYGFDCPRLPMDRTIEAFETLASREVKLASQQWRRSKGSSTPCTSAAGSSAGRCRRGDPRHARRTGRATLACHAGRILAGRRRATATNDASQ